MLKLYSKCFQLNNIKRAIKTVLSHSGSKTSGPDKINRQSNISEERFIREIKLRLRRYKSVNSRKIKIPKDNGQFRELTIINIFDRMAQQCVYQIINPILEQNMSKYSYGFRLAISAKIPVSKACSSIVNNKEIYTVEIDFEKCFDNIPLDKALDSLRLLGINDGKLIKTIKHLMWTTKDYSGVGLSQGTVLGPILANCYLTRLDQFMEENFILDKVDSAYCHNYSAHKGHWVQWHNKRHKKLHCKYYRYADDALILCKNKEEQDYINTMVREFIAKNLDIAINETKTKLGRNKFDFLGFKLKKNGHNVWIKIKDEAKLKAKIREFKFNNCREVDDFLKWLCGILNYFDIVNDAENILEYITHRLYERSRKNNNILIKIEGTCKYKYGIGNGRYRIIDVYSLRKNTKLSFKEYLFKSSWIRERELLKSRTTSSEYRMFLWTLFTRQKGINPITKKKLEITDLVIHHIKPKSKGGNDNPDNLILIDSETHKQIHGKEKCNAEIEKYRKHLK